MHIYIYILCMCIDVGYVQWWSVTILDAKCKEHRYILKIHKIKPKYSCSSEFHAKVIIRHIISFLSRNKQKTYLLSLEQKYKIQIWIKLRFTVSSLHLLSSLIRTCLNACIY